MRRRGAQGVMRVYRWPLALAVLTVAALAAGLLVTGVFDAGAVLGLAIPAGLCARALMRR